MIDSLFQVEFQIIRVHFYNSAIILQIILVAKLMNRLIFYLNYFKFGNVFIYILESSKSCSHFVKIRYTSLTFLKILQSTVNFKIYSY